MTAQSRRPSPVVPSGSLLAEVAVLDDVGPPRRRRFSPYNWTGLAWLTPTVLLLGLVIGWPVVWTAYQALRGGMGERFGQAFADPFAVRAVVLTVVWTVVVPLVVVILGYLLAQASRRTRLGSIGTAVLAAPMALSMVVTGIACRLLYDPSQQRGAATLVSIGLSDLIGVDPPPWLGPTLITVSVMSGFVWAWVGIAVLVFRAVLDGTPLQVIDAARAEGATVWDLLFTVRLPMLRRVAALLLALVAVGTARSFDLVLLMVPGWVRDDAVVLPVYMWQYRGDPGIPALGLVWLAILGVVVALASIGARQQWPLPITLPDLEHAAWWPRRSALGLAGAESPLRRRLSLVAVAVAVTVWAFPMLLLVSTAIRDPVDATTTSWASLPSPGSFRRLFAETPMLDALVQTFALAFVVTLVVVVLASLAAYGLVWLRPPGRGGTVVVLLFAAAVVPVPIIAPGVAHLLTSLGISNTPGVLVVIHVALGLPFAILLLRQAFAAIPVERLNQVRLVARGQGGVLRAVVLGPAKPALTAVAALEFVRVWNDLMVALLVAVPEVALVGPVLLTEARQFATGAGVLAAGAVVVSLVPLVIITFTWRHIVTALVNGVVRR
ncbi:MAG TPA: ABC transporter permease subunit [Micromonosporaceae bacterium]